MQTSSPEAIEKRAEQRLIASESTKTKLRKARRDRIQAGKGDTFDCSDEEDVVCPYCGAWFEGEEELEGVLQDWLRNSSPKMWHEVPCQECERTFLLRAEVRYTFTTIVREGN